MENANSPIRNTNSPISNGEFGHKYILQNLLEEGMFLSSKSPTLDRPLSSYLHFREPSGLKEVSYFWEEKYTPTSEDLCQVIVVVQWG